MALRRVVATVTLVGLGPGSPVWVDDADPQISRWIRGGQLRVLDPEPQSEIEALTHAAIEMPATGESELRSSTSLAPPGDPAPRRAAPKKVSK